jgi:hypothetical protein
MGVSLTGNYKGALSLDGGYGTFYRLRHKVAKEVLRSNYFFYLLWEKTDNNTPKDQLHALCEAIYSRSKALWNFVSQSDCKGKLSYKDCGDLYEKIKDSSENFSFCYDAHYTDEQRQDFIKLLKGCYSHRANLVWN